MCPTGDCGWAFAIAYVWVMFAPFILLFVLFILLLTIYLKRKKIYNFLWLKHKTKTKYFLYASVIFTVLFTLVYIPYAKEQKRLLYEKRYIDYDEYLSTKLCDKMQLKCLPEYADKSWQTENIKDDFSDIFDTNSKEHKITTLYAKMRNNSDTYDKYRKLLQKEVKMNLDDLSNDFFKRVAKNAEYLEIYNDLQRQFPDIWKDIKRGVALRWIRRVEYKADVFNDTGNTYQWADLCARIGINFDKDPQYEAITKFLQDPYASKGDYIGTVIEYLEWTLFEQDKSRSTNIWITGWSMGAIGSLPKPKRKRRSFKELEALDAFQKEKKTGKYKED